MALFRKDKRDELTGLEMPADEKKKPLEAEAEKSSKADVPPASSGVSTVLVIGIILAVVLASLMGFMLYKTHALSNANIKLEERIERDQKLQKSEDDYESQTDELNTESEDIIDRYGAGNTPEKTIMFLVNLTNTSGLSVNSVEFGDEENVTVDADGNRLKGAAKAPDPTKADEEGSDEDSDDSKSESSSSGSSAISAVYAAETGDSSADKDKSSEKSDKKSSSKDKYYLYKYPVTISYTGTYSQLKQAVKFIEDYGERMTINSISSTYDETTKQVTGSMTLNMYTLTGTEKKYSDPDVSGSLGNADIFG
ncbi:MAG: hypothetical protein SOV71_00065 [Anaerovoracaceae bacterium]|nr:hypothetical protein [Bacillota bacterium]MDY2669941.1 hypothetical protein [Anaerovoracaceae bacterium]